MHTIPHGDGLIQRRKRLRSGGRHMDINTRSRTAVAAAERNTHHQAFSIPQDREVEYLDFSRLAS